MAVKEPVSALVPVTNAELVFAIVMPMPQAVPVAEVTAEVSVNVTSSVTPHNLHCSCRQNQRSSWWPLLHKSLDGRGSPFPGQTHPTTSVIGVPSAVKLFSTAMRIWNSAP